MNKSATDLAALLRAAALAFLQRYPDFSRDDLLPAGRILLGDFTVISSDLKARAGRRGTPRQGRLSMPGAGE